MTREIWTGNYDKALPVSVQDFDLSAVLPAVFYMFRFGHRRGKGKFLETFGSNTGTAKERRQAATIERVASKLAENNKFRGFEGEAEQAILGDLLLASVWRMPNARLAERNRSSELRRPITWRAGWIFPISGKPSLCPRNDRGDAGQSERRLRPAEPRRGSNVVRRWQRI